MSRGFYPAKLLNLLYSHQQEEAFSCCLGDRIGQAQKYIKVKYSFSKWMFPFPGLLSVSKKGNRPTVTPRAVVVVVVVVVVAQLLLTPTSAAGLCGVSVVVSDNNFLILIIIPEVALYSSCNFVSSRKHYEHYICILQT